MRVTGVARGADFLGSTLRLRLGRRGDVSVSVASCRGVLGVGFRVDTRRGGPLVGEVAVGVLLLVVTVRAERFSCLVATLHCGQYHLEDSGTRFKPTQKV